MCTACQGGAFLVENKYYVKMCNILSIIHFRNTEVFSGCIFWCVFWCVFWAEKELHNLTICFIIYMEYTVCSPYFAK